MLAARADAVINPEASGGAPYACEGFSRFLSQPLWIALHEWALQHGPIFRLAFGPKAFTVLSDPAMAKHVLTSPHYSKGFLAEFAAPFFGTGLIAADAATHRRRAPLVRASMHRRFLERALGTQLRCAREAAAGPAAQAAQAPGGILEVDLEELYSRIALRTVSLLVFDVDVLARDGSDFELGEVFEAVGGVMREAEHRSTFFIEYWQFPLADRLVPSQRQFQAHLSTLRSALGALVTEAMATREEGAVEELMETREASSILRFLVDVRGEDASERQLLDDLMTLLIAGHETSAAVLTWMTFLLFSDDGAGYQEKVRDEALALAASLDGDERAPDVGDLMGMTNLRLCAAEALRLYPQPPVLIRRPLNDDVLPRGVGTAGGRGPDDGFPIQAGSDILLSAWSLGRNPLLWDAPDTFDPSRWTRDVLPAADDGWAGYDAASGLEGLYPSERSADYGYLPFGGGTRRCVGDQLGFSQVLLAYAALVTELDIRLVEPEAVGMKAGGSIHTSGGLRAEVRPRMSGSV